MKTIVTHQNFQECMNRVVNNETCFYIPTAYKIFKIDSKTIKKFAALNQPVIKLSKDGTGFRMKNGKNYLYVLPNQLIEN
jgi:hypothetical protein